jgi:ABC-type sugar transport system permease subunit
VRPMKFNFQDFLLKVKKGLGDLKLKLNFGGKETTTHIAMEKRRAIAGYVFISPFLLGLIFFFLYPFLQSVIFSFNSIQIGTQGYEMTGVGFGNYHRAFMVHPTFRRVLVESIIQMITDVPLIIIFSFFAANLINQKFRGRAVARAIFFLPVILTSGIILAVENNDLLLGIMSGAIQPDTAAGAVRALELRTLLLETRLHPRFVGYIIDAVDRLYEIVKASGVQILIFLAGLQTISPSLYEASTMEGATGWENFWKITFPMISPLILVNTVYTVIYSFTNPNNPVMEIIKNTAFAESRFGFSSAIAWVYFLVILGILGILIGVISRWVFYHD